MFFRATGRKALLEGKSFEETGEYSQLDVRPLPFQLDYIITFASLCDMIAQVYEKLSGHENIWNMHTLDIFQRVDSRFKVIY
jgi:benzoyl-CoA reductase/2-hydroxyglutaryl-CoA dehydratase subunit BcrC/BadD/HgdB